MTERIYEIDGEDFSTLEEFTKEITNIGLLEESGRKDSDTSKQRERKDPDLRERAILVWKNSNLSKQRFGHDGTINWLQERARKGEQLNIESYKEQFTRGEGKTLFDTLVAGVEILLKGDEERDVEIRFE